MGKVKTPEGAMRANLTAVGDRYGGSDQHIVDTENGDHSWIPFPSRSNQLRDTPGANVQIINNHRMPARGREAGSPLTVRGRSLGSGASTDPCPLWQHRRPDDGLSDLGTLPDPFVQSFRAGIDRFWNVASTTAIFRLPAPPPRLSRQDVEWMKRRWRSEYEDPRMLVGPWDNEVKKLSKRYDCSQDHKVPTTLHNAIKEKLSEDVPGRGDGDGEHPASSQNRTAHFRTARPYSAPVMVLLIVLLLMMLVLLLRIPRAELIGRFKIH